MRNAEIRRKTAETDITLRLKLDGKGVYQVDTGCGFLNHMLELFCRHGSFDLAVCCKGDTWVDDHHTVEDVGICLGKAFQQALGEMRGITRYGSFILPMDEVLMVCAVDLSGRAHLGWQVELPAEKVGTFDTELAVEFFYAFARDAGVTLHVRELAGANSHHIIEAAFKAVGRAMRHACEYDARVRGIPSTKGSL